MSMAFRKMENFLKVDCKRDIAHVDKEFLRIILQTLISSKMDDNSMKIFKKFVRFAYGLSGVTLLEGESFECYSKIMGLCLEKTRGKAEDHRSP